MTRSEETQMLRDIHKLRIAMEKTSTSLDDIAKSLKGPIYDAVEKLATNLEPISESMLCIVGIKTPNDVIIGDSESKNTEETRE